MLSVERLAKQDFGQLAGIEEGYVPDPEKSIAVVARDNGNIVARMLLISPFHIEGTWIHPEHRGATLLKRMIALMESEARKSKMNTIFAYADNSTVEAYLSRLGYEKTPLTVWTKCL